MIPFKSAGYSIPTAMSIGGYYNSGSSTFRLPLKDIKKYHLIGQKIIMVLYILTLKKKMVEKFQYLKIQVVVSKTLRLQKNLMKNTHLLVLQQVSMDKLGVRLR